MQVHDAAIHAQDVVTVVQDPPWPVRPRRPCVRLRCWEYLWERGGASKKTLFADCGEGARNALPALLQRGLVKIGPAAAPPTMKNRLSLRKGGAAISSSPKNSLGGH